MLKDFNSMPRVQVNELGMMVCVCNASSGEAERGVVLTS